MEPVYYEGSQRFMRGPSQQPKHAHEPQLSDVQLSILEILSDGKLHSIKELRERLSVGEGKLIWELDGLGETHAVYEYSYGRRCSIGVLMEDCFG